MNNIFWQWVGVTSMFSAFTYGWYWVICKILIAIRMTLDTWVTVPIALILAAFTTAIIVACLQAENR